MRPHAVREREHRPHRDRADDRRRPRRGFRGRLRLPDPDERDRDPDEQEQRCPDRAARRERMEGRTLQARSWGSARASRLAMVSGIAPESPSRRDSGAGQPRDVLVGRRRALSTTLDAPTAHCAVSVVAVSDIGVALRVVTPRGRVAHVIDGGRAQRPRGRVRRPRRRRGPSGAAAGVLARRARPSRPRRREEALPAREDLRRRAHAAGGPPAPRHGARRAALASSSASTACGRSRHGVTLELAWPEHPDFPPYGYVVRRRDLDEMVAERAVKAGADALAGDRGDRAGASRTASSPARSCSATDTGAVETVRARVRDRRRRRQLPVRPGPRHRPRPHATRSAWRSAAISPARSTTSRGSRATSTSATRTATTCPGTGGSSRWATAR